MKDNQKYFKILVFSEGECFGEEDILQKNEKYTFGVVCEE